MGLEISAPPNGRPATDGSEAAPAEGRTASAQPGADSAAPTPARELPKIAEKADDLEAIKKTVDDAASVGGGLWLSYLFVLFYLAVAAGAVTHADLFFENPVKLPFLNIELPLLAFFALAPILFLIVHAYTLVHLVMLTDKAKRFNKVLNKDFGDLNGMAEEEKERRKAIRDGFRRQLPSNIFVQFLAGPAEQGDRLFRAVMMAIAWVSLAIGPVLLLLLIQVQFLPFHNSFITWVHRFVLLGDLILLGWLWSKILTGRERRRAAPKRPAWRWAATFIAGLCVVLFSWTVVTFPGEWQEAHWLDLQVFPASDTNGQPVKVSLHDLVFNSQVDPFSRRRWLPVSSTLVLTGLNVYEGLKIDDPDKVKGRDFLFSARGRDLKGAILDFASLPKVDFAGADLQGASLLQANLQGASLAAAQLQGATLDLLQLQGGSLRSAKLQGDSLLQAQLQGASLVHAQLQGAWLDGVQLQGASLSWSNLQGARLPGAGLQGASLDSAQLQGALLDEASLEGASLDFAQLQGASLGRAQLQGASLADAQLQGASLHQAALRATDLSKALLWRTNSTAGSPADIAEPAAIRLPDVPETWGPWWRGNRNEVQPWNDKAYQDLRQTFGSLPPDERQKAALNRIRSLDCANPDPTLAPCDASVSQPAEAAAWRHTLEDARVDDAAYAKALVEELKALVCTGGDDAIYILRGLVRQFFNRLAAAGPETPALVGFIMSKDCLVSTSLTDTDKADLLSIQRRTTSILNMMQRAMSKKPGG